MFLLVSSNPMPIDLDWESLDPVSNFLEIIKRVAIAAAIGMGTAVAVSDGSFDPLISRGTSAFILSPPAEGEVRFGIGVY